MSTKCFFVWPFTFTYAFHLELNFVHAVNRNRFALFILVQFSCSVMSDSLQTHGPQHTRHPCPLPTLGVYSNSCPLSWWGHPTISSSVIPFSSCLQSFPASKSFLMSLQFASGGQILELQLQCQSFQWIFRIDSFRVD